MSVDLARAAADAKLRTQTPNFGDDSSVSGWTARQENAQL